MKNFIPNCPYTFKASLTRDPDTPNMDVDFICPYMEEFLEAIGKYISELEIHNNWNIMEKKSLP